MTKILCVLPTDETQRESLRAAAPKAEFVFSDKADFSPADLAEASVVLGNLAPKTLAQMPKLAFVQLNSAGTDGYLAPGVLKDDVVLCNATGSYGLAIGEYLTAMALTLVKKLPLYRDQQFRGEWTDHGTVGSVFGSNTLVLGLGDIGTEFAARMAALGSHVRGIKRTPGGAVPGVEAIGTFDDLDAWLPWADFVGMALPDTPQTRNVMNRERIFSMKKTAILLNAGRGTAVDTDALTDALRQGAIGGAGLDVTAPEPLPPEHPLWQCENCFITPHVSGGLHLRATHERIVALFCRNLSAYLNGGALESVVDRATGYRKSKMEV